MGERDLGAQPVDGLMTGWGLTNHGLVDVSTEQLNHKQVQKARKGRRLTLAMMQKLTRALNVRNLALAEAAGLKDVLAPCPLCAKEIALAHKEVTEDADLRCLLPEGDVEEGDTWEVDPAAWYASLSPSGILGFLDEDGNSSRDEIDEEIEIDAVVAARPVGIINDDSDPVGSVHFGVVHAAFVTDGTVRVRETELLAASFVPIADLRRLAADPTQTRCTECVDE